MKERKHYSDELKAEAVKMLTRKGMSHAEVARRLGIPKGNIGNWVAVLKEETQVAWPGVPTVVDLQAENIMLRKGLETDRRKF